MKTYADWKGNLYDYLQIGDIVDEEMVEYFIDVLPPACFNSSCIQMGEPYSHIDGNATYATLKKVDGEWVFAGNCFYGETEQPY